MNFADILKLGSELLPGLMPKKVEEPVINDDYCEFIIRGNSSYVLDTLKLITGEY